MATNDLFLLQRGKFNKTFFYLAFESLKVTIFPQQLLASSRCLKMQSGKPEQLLNVTH